MPLKPKNPQPPSEPSPIKAPLKGPWGRISANSHAVLTLRLCKKTSHSQEESYSYPYRVLSSWNWRGGPLDEELQIEAGSDLVTVKGRGLDRLVEALDCGTLEIVRAKEGVSPASEDEAIWVASIDIKEQT